jgi:hypothetical protein
MFIIVPGAGGVDCHPAGFNNGLGIKIALTFSQKQNLKLEWISREITNSPEIVGTKVLIQQIIP